MLDLKTRADLQKLIDDGIQESLTLEYKASPALCKTNGGRAELVKDVTAFANSAGGQVIYGIPENDGAPQPLDDGVDSQEFPSEWIQQVVDTNCSPRIQGMRVEKIELDPVRPHMVAYIVSVPQATAFAPHQNSIDKKYYRRFESRAVPMHDYEIRDVLRRNQTPAIVVRMAFQGGDMFRNLVRAEEPFTIETVIENVSVEPALYSIIELCYDKRLTLVGDGGLARLSDIIIVGRNWHRLQKRFVVPNDFPLMKGSSVTIGPPKVTLSIPQEHFKQLDQFSLIYNAIAPGFHERRFASLTLQNGNLSISEFSIWED